MDARPEGEVGALSLTCNRGQGEASSTPIIWRTVTRHVHCANPRGETAGPGVVLDAGDTASPGTDKPAWKGIPDAFLIRKAMAEQSYSMLTMYGKTTPLRQCMCASIRSASQDLGKAPAGYK